MSLPIPSFAVIALRWNPIQRWRAYDLADEFWHFNTNLYQNSDRQTGASCSDGVLRCSQTSAEQNEHRTSWKEEEVVENEAISHKRCHAKNKETRVRQRPRSRKPVQHHVNSIKPAKTLVSGASLHAFQHKSKIGGESHSDSHIRPKWPAT